VLPASWKPKSDQRLVRVGPSADGGYVVSEAVLRKAEVLFGLGRADDWRFEAEFQQRTGCVV
jgi:hypothetical protein